MDVDEDLKTANRLCVGFTLHLTLPYLIVALMMVTLLGSILQTMATALSAAILTVAMLFASASTSDEDLHTTSEQTAQGNAIDKLEFDE